MRIAGRSTRFAASAAALLALAAAAASAYTVTIAPASPRTVYLQVGAGTFSGGTTCNTSTPSCYVRGGSPVANPTINVVSVSVPTAAVGNGVAQAMGTDSNVTQSSYDGYVFCSANQLYVGSFYRNTNNGAAAAASLTATAPAYLVDAAGDTIPFSQITWTSSGNGDIGTEVFPGGTFSGTGSVQTLGTVKSNQWAESCWSFSFRNTQTYPGGSYSGRVLYTLTAP